MKHLDLLNEFRGLISQLRQEVEAAGAMQHYDIHKVSENVMCGLLKEFCGWKDLRNLNADQKNFPGIDLADDSARIAIQITATADLGKIKHTLETFISNRLQDKYDRLIVYILTARQASYSQSAIDSVTNGKFSFDEKVDVWDYQSLCASAADSATPQQLVSAINHLKAYLRGVPIGLADEDIDPPLKPAESLMASMIDVYFPADLYVAQLSDELVERHGKRRAGNWRKTIHEFCREGEFRVPSAYTVHGNALITFFNLEGPQSPFSRLIEKGTEEPISSKEFWKIDSDHENVFKALLRFSLQQRLFREAVFWEAEDKQFVFRPRQDSPDVRREVWQGEKKAERTVYARHYNKKDPTKVFSQKHLSFAVDFNLFGDDWFMSITPSWFFSYGDDFRKSGYGHENLSWIKRQENNQQVANHFRFIAAWLISIDEEDLFSTKKSEESFLSFGSIVSVTGGPALDESKWAALPSPADDEDMQNMKGWFR